MPDSIVNAALEVMGRSGIAAALSVSSPGCISATNRSLPGRRRAHWPLTSMMLELDWPVIGQRPLSSRLCVLCPTWMGRSSN